jgi:hypothetical protein
LSGARIEGLRYYGLGMRGLVVLVGIAQGGWLRQA